MKFDIAVFNPPYQEERKDTSDKPIYPIFLDAAYEIADIVETITPGRFLFNAGQTSKVWNEKMLNDEHLKVVFYEQDGSKIFPITDIKGGVAIVLRDNQKNFGAIKQFSPFPELNSIARKVKNSQNFTELPTIMYSQCAYGISKIFHEELPEESSLLKQSAKKFFATNVFDVLTEKTFKENKPNDQNEYIQLYGLSERKRTYKWINKKYVVDPGNLNFYKVILPNSNGSGAIGEVLSTPLIGEPLIGEPLIGHTQTFISVGAFSTKNEAENALKYIKSKFARTLLGVLKITQHNTPDKWAYVPLQDFTKNSDIDWSKSIAEIDKQLYRKYNLSQDEIDFIESKVKSMDNTIIKENEEAGQNGKET